MSAANSVAGAAWDSQEGFNVRFDWGPAGVARLAPVVEILVVVDVLRFTTAVETATEHGIMVYPYRFRDATAAAFATAVDAVLASRGNEGPSLSPRSLTALPAGSRIVLPSPNGAMCALKGAELGATVVAGCLRNAGAVASWVASRGGVLGVIACGELDADGLLRPAIEDLVGAGAILSHLEGSLSPEADSTAVG